MSLDIIYLLNNLGIGGSERKTIRVANGLAARGVRVGVAYLNGPEDLLRELEPGIPRWCLRRTGKYSLATVARLGRMLRHQRPRTVAALNLYPSLYLAPAARLAGAHRPKTILMINTSSPATTIPAGRRWLYGSVLSCIDRTVYGCEAVRTQWQRPGSVAGARSGVIYNGVNLAEHCQQAVPESVEACRRRWGIPAQAFVFGTVGRLAAEKNQRVLIEALRVLHAQGIDAHLLIVGAGRLRVELEREIGAAGMKGHATFTGALGDTRPAVKAMDVFVLPSTAVETFSNAALEAMAMEKAVILSDIGGAREMVREGADGFIVPPAELSVRLPALLAALAADGPRRVDLGRAARARVQRQFSLETMIDNHQAMIG